MGVCQLDRPQTTPVKLLSWNGLRSHLRHGAPVRSRARRPALIAPWLALGPSLWPGGMSLVLSVVLSSLCRLASIHDTNGSGECAYNFSFFLAALGLLRGALGASPVLSRALFVPLALPAPFPFLAFPPSVAAGAGVEAASEALSKEEACTSSPLVDDGGDEASLILTSFSSRAGVSWGKRLRMLDESFRTIVRLGGVVVFGGVGMMTPSLFRGGRFN